MERQKIKILMCALAFWICGNRVPVYASEFGGFDISTGTGEYDGDWSDWDDDPTYSPEQNDSNSYTDEGQNDGQETEQNNSGASFYTDDYEYNIMQNGNEYGNSTTPGSDASSLSGDTDDYAGQNQNDSENINNRSSVETGNRMNGETTSADIKISPVPIPTDTPTPVLTPTVKPTFTPTPVFTEVPKEKVNTVTEYKEKYRLPPAECLQKMQLFYWRKNLSKGEYMEIELNSRIMQQIVSVRLNGQEKTWKQTGQTLQINGFSDDRNKLEIAIMIPRDLAWTGDEKNVILTYNVF